MAVVAEFHGLDTEDLPILLDVSGLRRLDWELPDPTGQPVEVVRRIRDDIRARIEQLVAEEDWQRAVR